ncbi:hypothetical protein D3C79_1085770 [compost metagenome]
MRISPIAATFVIKTVIQLFLQGIPAAVLEVVQNRHELTFAVNVVHIRTINPGDLHIIEYG